MFGFEEWDSWLSFGFEVGISLAIVVGLIFVVRKVNVSAEADRQRYLQSRNSTASTEKQATPSDAQASSDSQKDENMIFRQ